jgi:hypothetical protein
MMVLTFLIYDVSRAGSQTMVIVGEGEKKKEKREREFLARRRENFFGSYPMLQV